MTMFVLCDHPGWDQIGEARMRAVRTADGRLAVLTAPAYAQTEPVTAAFRTPAAARPAASSPTALRAPAPADPVSSASVPDTLDAAAPGERRMQVFTVPQWPQAVTGFPAELARALDDVAPVGRWATPTMWEAIATAIIRQVIRADQARVVHARLRRAHGPAIPSPGGTLHAFPDAETVVGLEQAEFGRLGLAFKAGPLRHAADAYLRHHARWRYLPPRELVQALQEVPRIGPWTAGAAVADYAHDWSLYPYADLAVRTHARAAAPGTDWPAAERAFAERWRALAGGDPHLLGALTLFTLAWGARHAARTPARTSANRPPRPADRAAGPSARR